MKDVVEGCRSLSKTPTSKKNQQTQPDDRSGGAMSSGSSRRPTGMRFRTTILTAGKTAKATFDALSYSNQRRHADGIARAKTDETRQRRLEKTLAELHG